MISGTSRQTDDYYGYSHMPSPSVKEIRKLRRTQLSNEKKSNNSVKSLSSEKDSSLSNRKSRQVIGRNTSILKNDIPSSLKNSQSKYLQSNLPSSTEVQSINSTSIRKSRLQISTGVVGIKMDSLSPAAVMSHPSKVLFVNESTSGKKGSKSKKQKSILYVEYNNFMTELNNNKSSRNSRNKDYQNNQPHQQDDNNHNNFKVHTSKNLHKEYFQQKDQKNSKKQNLQQFSNVLPSNLENEYFTGMNRNCLSPVLGTKDKKQPITRNEPRNEQNGLLGTVHKVSNSHSTYQNVKVYQSPNSRSFNGQNSQKDSTNPQTPTNQTSIANLSITSTKGNKLQSPKLAALSPKMYKMEQNANDTKHPKIKISMHDIVVLKEKNQQIQQNSKVVNSTRESRGSVKSGVSNSNRVESYGIQVNIAENVFTQSIKKIGPQVGKAIRIQESNQQYFKKPIKEQAPSSQKTIKYSEASAQKQYKTQKQITILSNEKPSVQIQNPSQYTSQNNNQNFINPYHLTKNQNLVNNYQKKKTQNQFQNLVEEIKSKGQNRNSRDKTLTPGPHHFNTQNANIKDTNTVNFSQISESVVSNAQSKRGRNLVKAGNDNFKSSSSKKSLKSSLSRSKLKMPASPMAKEKPKIYQPKTPQPYSLSKKESNFSSNQRLKSSHNQQQNSSGYSSKMESVNNGQSKVSVSEYKSKQPTKKVKQIDDYYTPNPYNLKTSLRSSRQQKAGFAPGDDKSSIVSDLQSEDPSDMENFEMNSEISSMQSNHDKLSIKSGKMSNISSASRLKRQQIAKKSQLRSSRNSLKSNKNGSSLKISLNPIYKVDSFQKSSACQDKSKKFQSSLDDQSIKPSIKEAQQTVQQRENSSPKKAVKFLRVNKDLQSEMVRVPSRAPPKIQQQFSSVFQSNINSIKKSDVLDQRPLQKSIKPSELAQPSIQSALKKQSNIKTSVNKQSFNDSHKQSKVQNKKISIIAMDESDSSQEEDEENDYNNTSFDQQSSVQTNMYKKELAVENVQSEIQHVPSDAQFNKKLTDTLKSRTQIQQSMINTKKPLAEKDAEKSQKLSISKASLQKQHQIPGIKQQMDLQRSAYSIQSMKRSGKRQSIKNSIHASNLVSQQSQMMASRHGAKSNLSIRSGRNLKPFSMENPTIDEFIAYLDEYDIAIGFLYLYVENTTVFYCQEKEEKQAPQVEQYRNKMKNIKAKRYQEKYEKLAFLMMKKYLYQKNRIIKCLRSLQPNIFTLTDLQIPDRILKKFLNHEQTKEKLRQFELQTKELFKELEEQFRSLRLKGENKKNKLIRLETPYDNFTRDIVGMLIEELNQLTADIDQMEIETGSKISSENPSLPLGRSKNGGNNTKQKSLTSVIAQSILSSEQRGIEVMQLVFLASQLQSKKIKKLQLLNISEMDFEEYYENYIDKLLSTYEYFEGIKYPSDEQENKKG